MYMYLRIDFASSYDFLYCSDNFIFVLLFILFRYFEYIYISLRRARMAQRVRQLDYLRTHTSLSPIRREFAPVFVSYQKGARDSQVIKLTICSPGTPASSTTKPGRHNTAEILLNVALKKYQIIYLRWVGMYKESNYINVIMSIHITSDIVIDLLKAVCVWQTQKNCQYQ